MDYAAAFTYSCHAQELTHRALYGGRVPYRRAASILNSLGAYFQASNIPFYIC